MVIESKQAEKLPHPARRLVEWYKLNHRQLPWRNTSDAYKILVSETMLQQTRVETVIPYYYAFLDRFPDIHSLADANGDDVLKMWQGLGYYSRARNLQKSAIAIMENYEGVVPSELKQLLALPGVGPYTAGAVASIAFEKPIPAVDGNVLRVIARYCGIDTPIDLPASKQEITDIVHDWIQKEQPSIFTQSLMELGATVCTPSSPNCEACPLKEGCIAYQMGKTDELPRRIPKKARKTIHIAAFWLETDNRILLQRRLSHGLLANMWQLPAVEIPWQNRPISDMELGTFLGNLIPIQAGNSEEKISAYVLLREQKHIFTHLEWHVHVYRPVGIDLSRLFFAENDSFQFVLRQNVKNYVLPRVYEKILGSILGEAVR